jgi:hypothetical protein
LTSAMKHSGFDHCLGDLSRHPLPAPDPLTSAIAHSDLESLPRRLIASSLARPDSLTAAIKHPFRSEHQRRFGQVEKQRIRLLTFSTFSTVLHSPHALEIERFGGNSLRWKRVGETSLAEIFTPRDEAVVAIRVTRR